MPRLPLAELWAYRDLLLTFVQRDLRLRYRQTVLGAAWVALQPLIGAVVLAFVFGRVARLPSGGQPYLVSTLAALIGWTVFVQSLNRSAASLMVNAQLVTKVYFPRLCMPVSAAGGVLIDMAVGVVVLVIVQAFEGVGISLRLLVLPATTLVFLAYGLGLGSALAAVTVKYRDLTYVLPFAVQLLLFASPVAYSAHAVPSDVRAVVGLNPLTSMLEISRWTIGAGPAPSSLSITTSALVSLVVLAGGLLIFTARERSFADVV